MVAEVVHLLNGSNAELRIGKQFVEDFVWMEFEKRPHEFAVVVRECLISGHCAHQVAAQPACGLLAFVVPEAVARDASTFVVVPIVVTTKHKTFEQVPTS